MTEAAGGVGSAPQDPQVNPDPPEYDEEERPALQVTRRNLVVLGGFLLASLAALYFLLPQLAGLDDTWNRIGDGRPEWTAAALLFTFGMFGGLRRDVPRRVPARRRRASAGPRATRSRWPGSPRRACSPPGAPAGWC